MIDYKVDLADFNRQLKELGTEMATKTVRAGVRAAGGEFRTIARANAPVLRTPSKNRVAGALKRNIYVGIPRKQAPGQVRAVVSVRSGRRVKKGGDPFYWRFLEGGWIPRGPGRRITGGKRVVALTRMRLAGKRVAFPFMRPAFSSAGPRAIAAFEKKTAETIKKFSSTK